MNYKKMWEILENQINEDFKKADKEKYYELSLLLDAILGKMENIKQHFDKNIIR